MSTWFDKMTRDDALTLADRILALVNAQARTPSREEIAEVIGWDGLSIQKMIDAGALKKPIVRFVKRGVSAEVWTSAPSMDIPDAPPSEGVKEVWDADAAFAGACHIIQDTIYNPFDGRGLDLKCRTHDHSFNIKTELGQTSVPIPERCPQLCTHVWGAYPFSGFTGVSCPAEARCVLCGFRPNAITVKV